MAARLKNVLVCKMSKEMSNLRFKFSLHVFAQARERAPGILMEYPALMEYFFEIDDYISLTQVDCT